MLKRVREEHQEEQREKNGDAERGERVREIQGKDSKRESES